MNEGSNQNDLNNEQNNSQNNLDNNQNTITNNLSYVKKEDNSYYNQSNINNYPSEVVYTPAYKVFFSNIIKIIKKIIIISIIVAVGVVFGPKIIKYFKELKIDIPEINIVKNKELTRDVKFIAQELEFRFSIMSYDNSDIKEIHDACYRMNNEDIKGLITKFVSTYKYDKITCIVSNNEYNFDLIATSKYKGATFKIICPISDNIKCSVKE